VLGRQGDNLVSMDCCFRARQHDQAGILLAPRGFDRPLDFT
jgi:hypothetical protein